MQNTDVPMLVPQRSSALPWILLVAALLVGAGGYFAEKQRADGLQARADAARATAEKARADADALESGKHALEERINALQTDNGRLTAKLTAAESMKKVAARATPHKHARKHGKHKRA